jgi:hypothetical protein
MLDSFPCSFTSISFLTTQIKVKEQLVVRKDMDVNEHERLSNITIRHKFNVKEKLVVRNEGHGRLFRN